MSLSVREEQVKNYLSHVPELHFFSHLSSVIMRKFTLHCNIIFPLPKGWRERRDQPGSLNSKSPSYIWTRPRDSQTGVLWYPSQGSPVFTPFAGWWQSQDCKVMAKPALGFQGALGCLCRHFQASWDLRIAIASKLWFVILSMGSLHPLGRPVLPLIS